MAPKAAMKTAKSVKAAANKSTKVIHTASKSKAGGGGSASLGKVTAALRSADPAWLTNSHASLLLSVSSSLGVYKSLRVPQQHQMIQMIGDALIEREGALKNKFDGCSEVVENGDKEKVARTTRADEAKSELERLEAIVQEKKAALDGATIHESNMKAGVHEAITAEKQADKIYCAVQDMKVKVELFTAAFQVGVTTKLHGNSPAQKVPKTFIQTGKDLGLEMSMLTSLPTILGKSPEDRTEFEQFAVAKFGEALDKLGEVYSESAVQTEVDKKTARASAVAGAKDALASASEATRGCAGEVGESMNKVTEQKRAIKEAQKAVSNFEKDMSGYQKDKEASQAALSAFKEGPMAAFGELRDREAPEKFAKTCDKCGANFPKDSSFCNNCGAKREKVEKDQDVPMS